MPKVPFEAYVPGFDRPRSKARRRRMGSKKNIRAVVKQEIAKQVEKKYFLKSNIGAGITTTAAIVEIVDVPQTSSNATDITRIGDQITMTSYEFRGYIAGGDTYNLLRLMVFQWFPDYLPGASDILINAVNGVISPYSHDNRFDFNILFDRTYRMGTDWQHTHYIHFYIKKFRERRIQFDGGTTNGSNKLFLLLVSDSAALPNPTIAYDSKLNFKDM